MATNPPFSTLSSCCRGYSAQLLRSPLLWHKPWHHCMLTRVWHRTTPTFFTESGPGSYTKKAEFLRSQVHVDLNKDSLYDHYDNSWVPFTKLESGWIGYGGRVNDEPGPKKSAMEMCTFTSYVAGSDRICCWISYPRNVPYASIYPVIQMAVHFMGENLRIIGMEKQWKNGELE